MWVVLPGVLKQHEKNSQALPAFLAAINLILPPLAVTNLHLPDENFTLFQTSTFFKFVFNWTLISRSLWAEQEEVADSGRAGGAE